MTSARPKLAFVSPVFLFPADAGGKIRTGNILRGLLGGAFELTLVSPATTAQQRDWHAELDGVCDRFVAWQPEAPRARWRRVWSLWSTPLPVNVVADRTRAAIDAVAQLLCSERFDVVVFDFVHAAVLRPPGLDAATVCFTHNVESEIFARHAQQASRWLMRRVWQAQYHKMRRYEAAALAGFTRVIAVSQRDAEAFAAQLGVAGAVAIPTGVDLDHFGWREPAALNAGVPTVVFTGSMDWEANLDGVAFFLDQVWPAVRAQAPRAEFVVVGRRPPPWLVERARQQPGLRVTGFVDDVRPHVQAAHVFVIPLRVGGGTRIKAYEAMAMGCPVVSTSIGIEGLDIEADTHYLRRDDPAGLAEAVVALLVDAPRRAALSRRARDCVESRWGHRVAAAAFERICLDAMADGPASAPSPSGGH